MYQFYLGSPAAFFDSATVAPGKSGPGLSGVSCFVQGAYIGALMAVLIIRTGYIIV